MYNVVVIIIYTERNHNMKKTRRLLGLLLTLAMLATMIPVTMLSATAAPTSSAVVYVKTGGEGNGASPDAPTTLAKGVNTITAAGGGTVVFVGPVEIVSNNVLGNGDTNITVKITSVHGGVDYRETADAALVFTKNWMNISAKNNFEYENLTIRMKGDNCSFFGNGYALTFGKGIEVVIDEGLDAKQAKYYPNIYGGSAHDLSATTNYPADTSVTVLSGAFRRVFPSGLGTEAKPRPSRSATIALSPDVEIKEKTGFVYSTPSPDFAAVEGTLTLINIGGKHPAFEETADTTVETAGNGHVKGIAPGVVNICADSGYGAQIDGKMVPNGEYKFDGASLKVEFVESDINKEAELAAARPSLPASLPGEYIKGYDNGDGSFSFKPAGNITIAEATTILVRLMTTEEAIKGKYTTDKAKDTDWFYDNIAYLDTFGSFDTFDNFDGNRQITRAEFVKLITLYRKLTSKMDEIKFTDVAEGHKYYNDIKAGTMAKLVNGYDNGDGTFSFKPDAPITRAEVVTVINRVFDVADLAPIKYKNMLPNFTDVEETHWAAFQIIAAAGGKEKPAEKVDLSGTGEVEHTVDGAVIYVNGDGTGDGSSPENAIAWNKGLGLIKGNATFVVCGPVEFNSNFWFGPGAGYEGTVLITSVYGGVDYRATADAAIIFGSNWRNGVPSGTVIFDNIAFISRGTNCSIYCDNETVTFGRDVVCISEDGAAPIALYAGSANDLGACQNYIDSTSTSAANKGEYLANLTVMGGEWGSVSGTGNGSEAKPRESYGSAITIYEGAKTGTISTDNEKAGRKINGLRTIIINNSGTAAFNPDHFDVIVSVNGEATAEVASMTKTTVTVKVTANDGSKVQGVGDDGTVTFDAEGSLNVAGTGSAIVAVKDTKANMGVVDDKNAEYASEEYLKELDALEAKRIAEIKATKTEIVPKAGKVAYYVSSSAGDDANDGKSEDKPWKTIEQVNKANILPGDVVYFKRGDEWRGVSLKTKNGVSYTAYGEGEKPIINRSPFDGAKHGTWTPVEGYPNVYKYSERFTLDVGSVSFNERTYRDIYAQKILFDYKDGKPYFRTDAGKVAEDELSYLKNDLDFWHDCGGPYFEVKDAEKGYLYMRSDKGNPAERFTNIEFNLRISAISNGNATDVTIDNLTIRNAGVHGISSSTTRNLTVTNCVFEWIGGSVQNYTDGKYVRLGNAVEVYGGCEGYIVDNCYITDVYDAGVTHQVTQGSNDIIMKDVTYSNNVILRCIYSIEHFNRAPGTSYLANISYRNNLCRLAGYCFGFTRPDKGAASHIRSGNLVDTANFVIENNVFDRSKEYLFKLQAGGDEQIQWKNNVYIHTVGAQYGQMRGTWVMYNSRIADEVERYFVYPEINGKYLFVKE